MSLRAEVPGVVERLERHAAGERAVADDRDDRLVAAAQRRAPRASPSATEIELLACPVSKHVVRALAPLGEAAHAAVLAQRVEPLAPAGEQLVHVALVPDVPDDAGRAGASSARCSPRVSSTTPRFGARWPPVRGDGVDERVADLGGEPRRAARRRAA